MDTLEPLSEVHGWGHKITGKKVRSTVGFFCFLENRYQKLSLIVLYWVFSISFASEISKVYIIFIFLRSKTMQLIHKNQVNQFALLNMIYLAVIASHIYNIAEQNYSRKELMIFNFIQHLWSQMIGKHFM